MNALLKLFVSLAVVVGLAVLIWWLGLTAITPQPVTIPLEENPETSEEETAAPLADPLPITLASQTVALPDGTETEFLLAEPFSISVAAENLGKARFMTVSPDGRIFIPDLVNYILSREGKIFILDDFNEETKRFETTHTYLSGLRGPNSVAFYTDESGQDWIYIALTQHLVRYPYAAGDTAPTSDPEVVITFPNTQTPNAKSVVWHITRTLLFHDDRLYISVGSGCNACEQPEGEMRGMIFSMDPNGENVRVVADGLRNAVGMAFANGELYATENGADHLGIGAPDDLMYHVREGEHYGWPYCYESDGTLTLDTSVAWERALPCAEVPHSFAGFAPHAAPLGLTYFGNTHPTLRNSFLVALHGSFDAEVKSGYQIVRVGMDGSQEVFMDNFQGESGERFGRPVDILQKDENSFFVTDDHTGRVYYIYAE